METKELVKAEAPHICWWCGTDICNRSSAGMCCCYSYDEYGDIDWRPRPFCNRFHEHFYYDEISKIRNLSLLHVLKLDVASY